MEELLHYVWQYRLLPPGPLTAADGRAVEVLDPGLHNHDAGPDFFNAKVRIGGLLWVGNVEIHVRSSEWQRHGHHLDAAYDSVVLHVAGHIDGEAVTSRGRRLPQLQVSVPEAVRQRYGELSATQDYPRCWRIIRSLPRLKVHAWLSALLFERLSERSDACLQRLRLTGGDWERTSFITVARAFGFGLNGDAFEAWARSLPLHAAAKHRDDAFQVEALFLGSAGLLEASALPPSASSAAAADTYLARLRREWAYLSHKFSLTAPMDPTLWRYLRLRPQSFPHLRIAQLAQLYHRQTASLATLMEARSRAALHEAFATEPSPYWRDHYLFGLPSRPSRKSLSAASRDLLIINAVCPLLFARSNTFGDEAPMERAIALLEELPAEHNFITRQWHQCGIDVATAADSQALVQLKRQYCDRHDCLRCRFGYEYLRGCPPGAAPAPAAPPA
ncbi:MAG: DUF2851 family protein [Bacteroidaceae bacterium]|nr:DUF2851 family protein [Bacteroidaceae bacterium]